MSSADAFSQSENPTYILFFNEIRIDDVPIVGGKNASLGEMYQQLVPQGVPVPNGFAVTAEAYRALLSANDLWPKMHELLDDMDAENSVELQTRGTKLRDLIYSAQLPDEMYQELCDAYLKLTQEYGDHISVAVRSSATAEDLPTASFAGQQDTYLNVTGLNAYIDACRHCFASLFTDRAIHYRVDQGFDHFDVALSIGVQVMVRSDIASSGVMFTIDTETGFEDVILITGAYGLGENVVQGAVDPDEFYVHKKTYAKGYRSIFKRHLGSKKIKMVYSSDVNKRESVRNIPTAISEQKQFCITDKEALKLAEYALKIEAHYSEHAKKHRPMDIEWAKDGITGELLIVQARPETVASQQEGLVLKQYHIETEQNATYERLVYGRSVGAKVAAGKARVIESVEHLHEFKAGEVLVADMTTPDWEPVMKIASALVTNRGGRTCHAAIIARELGIPAVVGCAKATEKIITGQKVTVSCAEGDEGRVYKGQVPYEIIETDLSNLEMPKTDILMNLANPESAFRVNKLPNSGVGLARMEFIINNKIQIHPQALLNPEKVTDAKSKAKIEKITQAFSDGKSFFINKLSEGIGTLAAGFYPKPVVVRLSDFKSNEYANLIGGQYFEAEEENPMIGFRGAARYNDTEFAASFAMECQALKQVREVMGFDNIIVMVPFCRRVDEARAVVDTLASNGLVRGANGLKLYMMCEIPNNVLLMDEFSEFFDGFSIGTNDLAQLVLGVDRDSAKVAYDYDERDPGVKKMVKMAIQGAKRNGKYIGLCGQAPSDYPEFAQFLVDQGIDSMSLNPDSILLTLPTILAAEKKRQEG